MTGINRISAFPKSRRGAVAILFAMMAPALIGIAGLGVEVGLWYQTKNSLKSVADAAALAGVRELAAGNTSSIQAAVTLVAVSNGCSGDDSCKLDVPTTYKTSNSVATDDGVQVTARASLNLLFAGMFLSGDNGKLEVAATSKAVYVTTTTTSSSSTTTTSSEPACILGLDTNAAYTVYLKNNVTLNCAAVSNSKCLGKNSSTCKLDATTYGSYSCSPSTDPQCNASLSTTNLSSMLLSNNATISADATAAGLIYMDNNAKITGKKIPNGIASTDPYASVTIDPPSITAPATTVAHTVTGSGTSGNPYVVSVTSGKCSTSSVTYSNNKYITINPGCYNGWDFKNNATITLLAGTYYIRSGFSVSNNARITGTSGTTIVLVGNYAMDLGNNGFLTLTAPSSGTFQGIALMGDPSGTATVVQTFSNNAILDVKGAIYFRNQILNLENNGISSSSGCLQLIARRVLFSNNATIGTSCSSIGTKTLSLNQAVTTVITTTTSSTSVQESQ